MAVGIISFSIASCGDKTQESGKSAWEKERDSLQYVNAQQQMILDDITTTMADISMSLDTISMHESMIIRRIDEEGNPLSKKGLKSKLNTLSEIIKNQREKMAKMEKTMTERKSSVTQLKSIIAYLNVSLMQKEAEIQQLKAEVDSKNFSIASLNTHVSSLRDTVASVRQENEEQRQQMERQNAQHETAMNEVYYIIGTKEKLLSYGVLTKQGLFKISKVNFSSIDKSVLIKGDKRNLKKIIINGKSPKMLSEAPKESYALDNGASSSTLTILDAEKFWSANNKILVIQVK
jgi:uncharacterized protein (DUF3084 family)